MKVKYPAVIVATIVHFFLGALWYSPLLFGNKFIELMKWTPDQLQQLENESHATELLLAFLASLVMVYMLALFIQYTKASSAVGGIQIALLVWLGFIVTTLLPGVLFERRSVGLFAIDIAHHFVGCILVGAILGAWRLREASEPLAQPA